MYVRRYTPNDWRAVIAIARQFHEESPVHGRFPFDEGTVRRLLDNALGQPNWLPAVCLDDGKIIGIMLLFHMPMFFGPASEVGDLAFYVVPDRRGGRAAMLLLEYGERWAADVGAVVVRLGVTTGIRDVAVSRFLERCGFKPVGRLLEKSV